MLKKKSFRLDGHATSIALEPEFWQALTQIQNQKHIKMDMLILSIDIQRDPQESLASALRVYCLNHYMDREKVEK